VTFDLREKCAKEDTNQAITEHSEDTWIFKILVSLA
jgi:hypothetical protein